MPATINFPPDLTGWLTYQGFLTKKLRDIAGDACLHVLDHVWEEVDTWDKVRLNIIENQVLHREICMYAWDKPCWYARTVLPLSTYLAAPALFDRLKHESLGVLIFEGSKITRQTFTQYVIDSSAIEYSWLSTDLHQQAHELWARLSEFKLDQQYPFYLLEILLPELARYPG